MGEARRRRMEARANGSPYAGMAPAAQQRVSLFVVALQRPPLAPPHEPPFMVQAFVVVKDRGPVFVPWACPCASPEEAFSWAEGMAGVEKVPRQPDWPPHVLAQWKLDTFRWRAPTPDGMALAAAALGGGSVVPAAGPVA